MSSVHHQSFVHQESRDVAAFNFPIQLDVSHHLSLKRVQEAVRGRTPLHLTLLFTVLCNELIQKAGDMFQKAIREEVFCKKCAETLFLHFHKFHFLKRDLLVALFEPYEKSTEQPAIREYSEFITHLCDCIRQVTHETYTREVCETVVDPTRLREDCFVRGHKVYSMDLREPCIHITIKRHATLKDKRVAEKHKQIDPIVFRVEELIARPTMKTSF